MDGFEHGLSFLQDAFPRLTTQGAQEIGLWFLAWMFVVSGIAKVRRPKEAAGAMVEFRVVKRFRPWYGLAVGTLELLLALFLALGIARNAATTFTAALLWFFAFLIARSLVAGNSFSCFCFGETDSELSRATLIRTAALAVLASALGLLSVSAQAPATLSAASKTLAAAVALAMLATVGLAATLPGLLRSSRSILTDLEAYGEEGRGARANAE